jgi:hypothetical protein
MEENRVSAAEIAIVDDTFDMGLLADRFVRATPLNGLDTQTADAIVALFDGGRSE